MGLGEPHNLWNCSLVGLFHLPVPDPDPDPEPEPTLSSASVSISVANSAIPNMRFICLSCFPRYSNTFLVTHPYIQSTYLIICIPNPTDNRLKIEKMI